MVGSVVLLVLGADVTTKMMDQTYFSTNQTSISLKGNLTNWAKITTNGVATAANWVADGTGADLNGAAAMKSATVSNLLSAGSLSVFGAASVNSLNVTSSLTVSNFVANTLIIPPVAWTQTTTNLILDLGLAGWQTNTATADVHVTCSNIAAGRIVTLDIWAGTTNRNLSFDTPLTNWFSAVPSTIASNHIMRISFMPPDDQTNHITLAAAQSFP